MMQVDFNAKNEYDMINNYKVLQDVFNKLGVEKVSARYKHRTKAPVLTNSCAATPCRDGIHHTQRKTTTKKSASFSVG